MVHLRVVFYLMFGVNVMKKHKCIKCNKDATVIEHGKYLCSQHGKQYVFSIAYKTTNREAKSESNNDKV